MSDLSNDLDSLKLDDSGKDDSIKDIENTVQEKIDKYFIDEDYLKDLENTLTESDKENKHKEAIEQKNEGNNKFKDGLYEDAADTYTKGLKMCPISYNKDRAILYANRAAARAKLNEEQKKASINDCDMALILDPLYLKAIQRRAKFHQELDNLDEAFKDYKRVLELDPGNNEAMTAVRFLPQQIEERNEKLKAEMLGKLKDLGNVILKPFGLSTDNFQLNQNSDSGGYTINFKK